ncbi:MAG: HAD hydrolase-like protein, partial [Spirochaetales bacterium]|nr:HAD hydrolase-like protein [Spirochaetales bacterium]
MAPALRHLLVDLDDTLYPASSGLREEIERRMNEFVARFLEIDAQSAVEIRRDLSRRYGATLSGLIQQFRYTRPDEYLAYTHPTDIERYLRRDPELRPALERVRLRMSVLTNSPREHAVRILSFLGIQDLFRRIYDIRFNDMQGKPHTSLYTRVLHDLQLQAAEVLLIDNRVDYLLGFEKLGGRTLLVEEGE